MSAWRNIGEANIEIIIGAPALGVPAVAVSTAGARGPGNPIVIEFVQSPGRVPFASFSAGGDLALDVTTRLRDSSLTASTVNIRELHAGGTIQGTFHDAQWDSVLDFLLPSSVPAGIVVGATSSPTNDATGISTNQFYRSHYYPDTSGPLSIDVLSAFGFNNLAFFNFTTAATYNIGFAPTTLGSQGFLKAADADVTINRLTGPAPFALLAEGVAAPIVIAPATAASFGTGVSISPPAAAMTAVETPLSTVVGSALTTYFGVTDADAAAMTTTNASPNDDVLVLDFATLDPTLLRTNRVTKPLIVWQ
jgi:hypothetical protein